MMPPLTLQQLKALPRAPGVARGFRAAVAIGLVWATLLGTLALAAVVRTPWFLALCLVAVGVAQYHLNILGHDGLHYALFERRGLNEWVTRWLLVAPQGMPMSVMRANHLNHHLHLGDASLDGDVQYYGLADRKTRASVVWWLLGAFGGVMAVKIAAKLVLRRPRSTSSLRAPGDLASVFLVQGFMAGFAALCWGGVEGALLWLVPLGTVFVGLNSTRSMLEHALLPGEPDSARLMTFRSNAVERLFLAPYNMNHHAEHHWFMHVPWGELPAVRAEAMRLAPTFVPVPSYFHRLRLLWRALGSAR